MKKHIAVIVVFFSFFLYQNTYLIAQNSINLDSNKEYTSNMNFSFSSFQDSIKVNFNAFQQNQKKAFDNFKNIIQQKMGSKLF